MNVEAKICGLTRADDAAQAVAFGAWRLGVVFASGPRVVSIAQARAIVDASNGVPVLGVFGPQPLRSMLETVHASGLSGVQLHGQHDHQVGTELRAAGLEVWRVVALAPDTAMLPTLARASENVDAVLLEAHAPGGSGGRGISIPLDLARAAVSAAPETHVVLAGGLKPETVGEAIRIVRPAAVDVSSGVESSPGVKDWTRLARFMENVIAARIAG